jgi:hypothetical protein
MDKKRKLLISQLIFIPIIGFGFYMATLCAIRSSLDYNNLIHVKGIVRGFRHIKHYELPGKFESKERELDVIAFKVVGFDDEFGIIERDDNYSSVRTVLNYSDSNIIDMYYDPKEQRIEDGITLHIFELIIDNSVIETLQDTKNSERKGILIFGLIGLFFLGLDIYTLKENVIKTTHANS